MEQIAREIEAGTPTSCCSRRSTGTRLQQAAPTSPATTRNARDAGGVRRQRPPPGQRRVRRRDPVEVPDRRPVEHAPAQRPEPPEGAAARHPEHQDPGRGHRISVYNTHLQHIYDELRLRQMHVVAGIVAADPLPKIMAATSTPGRTTRPPRRPRRPPGLLDGRGRRLGHTVPAAPEGPDRLRPVLRPAGAPELAGLLLRRSPTTAPYGARSPSAARANQSACPSSTNPWSRPPPRPRSQGSRRRTHPRGPHGATN